MSGLTTVYPTDKLQFVMLSFEGPDLFSMAGGLGIRATELCKCLAELGYPTHLYFVGDPILPATEQRGNWTLHRWSQWLSAANPGGCYVAENQKVCDFASSLPSALIEQVIAPAAAKGVVTVILAEEWQTIPAVINLDQALRRQHLEKWALILWNANNLYGFEGVNWEKLRNSCVLTTVSRYMKHRMWLWGVNPIVIHNGIPRRLLQPVSTEATARLRQIFPDLLVTKVGRYDVDKRWVMAMGAMGHMKRQGMKPTMIARGGKEHHRYEVRRQADLQGLTWKEITLDPRASMTEIFSELERYKDYDVLELCFFVPEEFINILYAGSDCVLANSGHEPFGLVGLEVMACGGLPFVGATGEDYAQTMVNSAVVETEDPLEIVEYLKTVQREPELVRELRQEGRRTAACYSWERFVGVLLQKIRFVGVARGIAI